MSCYRTERIILLFIFTLILFLILILLGTVGYVYLFELNCLDAFYNASLILTTISLEVTPITDGQKVFIIIYSMVSVILFLSIVSGAINKIFDLFLDKRVTCN